MSVTLQFVRNSVVRFATGEPAIYIVDHCFFFLLSPNHVNCSNVSQHVIRSLRRETFVSCAFVPCEWCVHVNTVYDLSPHRSLSSMEIIIKPGWLRARCARRRYRESCSKKYLCRCLFIVRFERGHVPTYSGNNALPRSLFND